MSESNTRRLWAYLTVKQLLDKELQLDGEEKERAKQEVLELSLKYRFVTPHTSMVVTKPPGENAQVLHKPKEGEKHPSPQGGSFGIVQSSAHYDDLSATAGRLHGGGHFHRHHIMQPSINGQLESYPNVGFKRIVIHNQNQRIDINQHHIHVNDGQNATKIRWEPNIIDIQRGKLIQSHNKTTIMIEDSLLIIMRHEEKGKSLLWPIFSQVSNDPVEGLLAVKPLVYESVSAPSGTVTVSGKTFTVSEGDIFDYSVTSAPRIKCWLTSAENALEGRLFDFLVTDL
ncbi:unnamed protein product [Boreogadus saida]